MRVQHLDAVAQQGFVPNHAAELKLELLVPGFLKEDHPFSVEWRLEPLLCGQLWQLFQAPSECLSLSGEHIALFRRLGLLLPPESLPLYAVSADAQPPSDVQAYRLPPDSAHWLLNLYARLHLVIQVPLRGQTLASHTFDWQVHADVCRTVWRFFAHPEQTYWSPDEAEQLQRYGLHCPPQQLSQPVRWLPRLDRADTLAPYAERLPPLPEALCLNPHMHWQKDAGLPSAVKLPSLGFSAGAENRPLLWVQGPQNLIWTPFLPHAEQQSLLEGLLEQPETLAELSPYMRRQLFDAGILMPADPGWRPFADLPQQLAAADFCVIPKLLNPSQVAGLRHYLRAIEYEGQLKDGDRMVERRLCRHNEKLCRWLQHQFYPVIAELTGLPLKPSYCYLAVYHSGALLARHTDREQCAWNLSLVMDMQPEREAKDAWPIYLETEAGVQEVRLEMGDGILYRGDRYPHWRPPLPPRHKVAVCFFHFVDASFDGLLD